MRIVGAEEHDGYVTASVEFDDGQTQTIILPSWASKDNFKDEAQRLRDKAEAMHENKVSREDLCDEPE